MISYCDFSHTVCKWHNVSIFVQEACRLWDSTWQTPARDWSRTVSGLSGTYQMLPPNRWWELTLVPILNPFVSERLWESLNRLRNLLSSVLLKKAFSAERWKDILGGIYLGTIYLPCSWYCVPILPFLLTWQLSFSPGGNGGSARNSGSAARQWRH